MIGVLSTATTIPPEIKKIVSFIYVPSEDGKPVVSATGFFVSVKISEKPKSYFMYFVTAKHVLQKPNKKSYYSKVFIRLNKKGSGIGFKEIPIIHEGDNKNVFMHKDPTVDIVVIPAMPNPEEYDFKSLPDDQLSTKEDFKELKIREGSEIFFTGLFRPHMGEQRNYPVVRFGRVALVTDEKIKWHGQKTELYLIESASFGGNSGSPVFFYLGIDSEPGVVAVRHPILKLAGVMIGSFVEWPIVKTVETAKIEVVRSNLGIAAVVPSYLLQEILFSDELVNIRKKHTEDLLKRIK
jgi:hypothetical protein